MRNMQSNVEFGYQLNYPLSYLLFKTELNSVGLSVSHSKHIASPLRVQ
jgi:hypothetical protein